MSQRHRTPAVPGERTPGLFAIPQLPGVAAIPPEQVAMYVAALEARCNTLWSYIQGYECVGDPVIRFLAAELGITVSHAGDLDAGPVAD